MLLVYLRRKNIHFDKITLIITVWTLLLILHLIACLWGVAGTFNIETNVNWIYNNNLQDSDPFYQYLS